jgi:hypothetical protein
MNGNVWAVVDATHPDAWTAADRQVSAAIARDTYRRMLQDLNDSVAKVAPPERRFTVVLEGGRPWWQGDRAMPPPERRFELPFDRGSGPALLLALLTVAPRDPQGTMWFASGRHGGPIRLHREVVPTPNAERPTSSIGIFGAVDDDWRRGAAAVMGSIEVLLEAYRLTQPGLLHTFSSGLRRVEGDVAAFVEETYPYLPDVDLFRDVLAAAVDLTPTFADRVQNHALSAA